MGSASAFKALPRRAAPRRPVALRVHDWREVYEDMGPAQLQEQGARCMDCGVPFCQGGCPLGNWIPVWNDLVYRGQLREAAQMLLATNDFPEFTGRICPAPCEEACVLSLAGAPVTIEHIEHAIIEHAFAQGWITPRAPRRRSGKRVAVIGSGPAGLSVASRLNLAGHEVTVFERDDRIGGLLRYGIPDFKLEKAVLDRRLRLLEAEGVRLQPGVAIAGKTASGGAVPITELRRQFDVICLAIGSTAARDLPIPGRELRGVHLAMEYLVQQNRRVAGDGDAAIIGVGGAEPITAAGKRVVILGGGDTGADCLGTAHRQGARSVLQLELMPRPPEARTADMPWPAWPLILRQSPAHEEGGERDYAVRTLAFLGDGEGGPSGQSGALRGLQIVRLQDGQPVPGSEHLIEAELCLLALGFTGPQRPGVLHEMELELTPQGNVRTDERLMTSVEGIFAAGDARRGQSLVVWALADGRKTAAAMDAFLLG